MLVPDYISSRGIQSLGGGAPLQRVPSKPKGPDPYVETREKAQAEARAGALAPVNQHGCMYFSSNEWVFCPMCEWEKGHALGVVDGTLSYMGGTKESETQKKLKGDVIRVTREELDAIFKEQKTFLGPIHTAVWTSVGAEPLSRATLHNLLMKYGAPTGCLTDDLWTSLKERHPSI